MKICRKCGTQFDTRNCKTCDRTRHAAIAAAHPEKIKAKSAKYRAANSAKIKLSNVRSYANNPEKAKARIAKWHANHPEKAKIARAKWLADNQEKAKSYTRKWDNAHPENLRSNYARWRAANPEKARLATAAWEKAHPESNRLRCQNRRAKKLNNGGILSAGLPAKLFKLQRGKCACCGLPLGNNYHLDHRMPLALGGANEDRNMQLLRKICNLQKCAKHPIDFMQSRGFLL